MEKATHLLISFLGNECCKPLHICVLGCGHRFCSVSFETVAKAMVHAMLGELKVQVNEVRN